MKRIFIIIISILALLAGCSTGVDHKGRTPVVEADGHYLYLEDVLRSMPTGLSPDDSAAFVGKYAEDWAEDILMYEMARRNIPDNEHIETLVDKYRRSLILHSYQNHLIEQKLTKEIDEAHMADYYEKNSKLFRAPVSYIRGIFVKVPLSAPDLVSLRRWCDNAGDQESVEKIEKYCISHAAAYDYFADVWRALDSETAKMPRELASRAEIEVLRGRMAEEADTTFRYFLKPLEVVREGEVEPLDLAAPRVREVLVNMKRVDFLEEMAKDLTKRAEKKDKLKFYYKK